MCKMHIYTEPMNDPIPAFIPSAAASADEAALLRAFQALLAPLAELAVARGLPCPVAENLMRLAWVQAANRAHHMLPPHRRVSRIATSTGLSRREVTRLTTQDVDRAEPSRRPLANEVFARWLSDPQCRQADGRPRRLPRSGPAPSFEWLAQSVTKDVHPRTLLDELLRLNLVRLDDRGDEVELLREAFVPRGDSLRMMELLADNTSDHLRAAVDNVLGRGREHLEQAVFADELSSESLKCVRQHMNEEWQALLARLVPLLEGLIEDDARAGRLQDQRLRVGLYSFTAPMGEDK